MSQGAGVRRRIVAFAPLENDEARRAQGPAGPDSARSAMAVEAMAFFDRLYPDPRCGLNFSNPFELLSATILSAQCTDERVNLVTPALFAAFPTPADMAQAPEGTVEELVKTCGLFRNKSANLRAAARILTERHGGQVPRTIEELTSLPGVGRKTANVVLGDAFGVPGLTVDTHLGRVSRRMGLSDRNDPEGVERDLALLIPQERWTGFSHQAIAHGRALCRARKPSCSCCVFKPCRAREAPSSTE